MFCWMGPMNSSSRDQSPTTLGVREPTEDDTTAWLKSAEYLPQFLRDFHDQKDFFKALDEVAQNSIANGNHYIAEVSWIAAQVYTVDIFLWMAARHGYTLQRSRKRVLFRDVWDWVSGAKARRNVEMASALGLTPVNASTGPGMSQNEVPK